MMKQQICLNVATVLSGFPAESRSRHPGLGALPGLLLACKAATQLVYTRASGGLPSGSAQPKVASVCSSVSVRCLNVVGAQLNSGMYTLTIHMVYRLAHQLPLRTAHFISLQPAMPKRKVSSCRSQDIAWVPIHAFAMRAFDGLQH